MRLLAAFTGRLTEMLDDQHNRLAGALRAAVAETSEQLKQDLRSDVLAGGLGERLAKTWQNKIYPGSNRVTLGPAGLVFSKAPDVIRAFDEGAKIRSSDGFYLAVPTEAAGRGSGGKRLSPGEWERRNGVRLRFVYRQGGPSLLVADNARLDTRGRARANVTRAKAGAYTRLRGRVTVPIFILLPQVSLAKRLDIARSENKALAQLQRAVAAAVNDLGDVY